MPSAGGTASFSGPVSRRGQHDSDEAELTEFDADVEEEQRERDGVLRETDFAQRAGEAESVQQAEYEGNDPWRA